MRKINSDCEILKENIEFNDKTIIDVGCGAGELVRWMASENTKVTGIDTPEMIEKALNYPTVKDEKYIIGKGEKLPIDENFADVMTFIASFHHIPHDLMLQALDECYRVLKPKGKVVLIEPVAKKGSYYEIIKLAEDEADIQNKAYQVIKNSDKAQFTFLKEESFFLERSFNNYIKLIKLFVKDKCQQSNIIEKARQITLEISKQANVEFDDFLFKSVAKLIVLQKN